MSRMERKNRIISHPMDPRALDQIWRHLRSDTKKKSAQVRAVNNFQIDLKLRKTCNQNFSQMIGRTTMSRRVTSEKLRRLNSRHRMSMKSFHRRGIVIIPQATFSRKNLQRTSK